MRLFRMYTGSHGQSHLEDIVFPAGLPSASGNRHQVSSKPPELFGGFYSHPTGIT